MKKSFILCSLLMFTVSSIVCYAASYSGKVPLPGSSVANAKLQYDTLMPVYMSVKTKVPKCETMAITNTKVTKQPYNLKYLQGKPVGGEWAEMWTVNACNKNYDVPVKFILDSTGATYMISPKDIIVK